MIQKMTGCLMMVFVGFVLLLCAGLFAGNGDGDKAEVQAPAVVNAVPKSPRRVSVVTTPTEDDATPSQQETAESARIAVASEIPGDLSWTAETLTDEPGVKRSIQIRLGRRANYDTLRSIAAIVKSRERANYDRTFISYLLPDQEPGQGHYATAHYEPELKVRVRGLTLENADATLLTALRESKMSDFAETVGWWWADEPGGGIEVISQRHDGFSLDLFHGDGGGRRTLPLSLDKLKSKPRFSFAGKARSDNYEATRWTIEDGGDLLLAENWETYARRSPVRRSDLGSYLERHPEQGQLVEKVIDQFPVEAQARPQGAEIVTAFRNRRHAAKLATAEKQKQIETTLERSRDLSDREVRNVLAKIVSLESANRRVEYLNELSRIRPTDQDIGDAARAARIEQLKDSLETAISPEDRLRALKVLLNAEPEVSRWDTEYRIAREEKRRRLELEEWRAQRRAKEKGRSWAWWKSASKFSRLGRIRQVASSEEEVAYVYGFVDNWAKKSDPLIELDEASSLWG